MRTYSRMLTSHSFIRKPQESGIPEFLSRRRGRLPLKLLPVCVAIAVSGCNWSTLVSKNDAGQQGNGDSKYASISADGRYIAFNSTATNFVANDTNGTYWDVFVRDTLLGVTTMVSVNSDGEQSNDASYSPPGISEDGRYVAFVSAATNLVDGDTNNVRDVFLHDRVAGITTMVSINRVGNEANRECADVTRPALSTDGRYIAFTCNASNLMSGDIHGYPQVFVHDRVTGSTTLVSVDSAGNAGTGGHPDISADGRYVAFASSLPLVADDTNDYPDVYVHDRDTGVTTRVSISSAGVQGNSDSVGPPSISNDGRYVAFHSHAWNLVPGAQMGFYNVFVHDRSTGATTQVSVDSSGNHGNYTSFAPDISPDGRYVTFQSSSNNLVAGDTNGHNDVFVHDRVTGATTRESVDTAGNGGSSWSEYPRISADARYVVFHTPANSVSGGTNGKQHMVMKALTHLTVTGMLPSKLPVGTTTSVTITGTNFLPGSVLNLDASVNNVVIVDEQTITADVTVPAGHATGASDVTVYLPGTGPGPTAGSAASCDDCVTFTSVPNGC